MNWFHKLKGFQRSAPGLEWALWRRLPALLLWGTALPALASLLVHLMAPDTPTPGDERALRLMDYMLIGVVVLDWTLVLTLLIGCAIVIVMKGPAYVADPYPPPGREPLE
ncbi:hypothetical protein C7444_12010 [Sphaerotilus hippei]|uniref:Uncharacterized protein n=1 Tax=Sphaerotilus hippei TaxID=744406 RepID=A0A318GVR6_9BURK|nr:hypothetical protein [Sphaerotilus hippei]PXW93358.1 hypothetical protein C7444_12010 [Sphaerotilus hippei]